MGGVVVVSVGVGVCWTPCSASSPPRVVSGADAQRTGALETLRSVATSVSVFSSATGLLVKALREDASECAGQPMPVALVGACTLTYVSHLGLGVCVWGGGVRTLALEH